MTLQLAVKITGDASDLKREAAEARAATDGLGASLDAAGAKATGAAGRFDAAAAAAGRLDEAERLARAGRGRDVPGPPGPPPVPGPPLPANDTAPRGPRSDFFKQLGFQANDIGTSLASGAPITQVIGQQAGQIIQTLGDHPGGVAGGLKLVADRALSILTPVRLATGGFVGLGAAMAAAGVQWSQSQSAIEKGLTGIGAMSRATVTDINRIAEEAAAGSRGRLSTGEARSVATTIAATGKVDVSNIRGVADLAPGYAQLFGKDVKEAGEDLARIFSDPVKGAEELNARIGGLDASTQRYVRTLAEQGDRQEAIRVLVSRFGPEIEKAAEKTGLWTAAWNALGGAIDKAGKFVAGPFVTKPPDERLKQIEEELSAAEYQRAVGGGYDNTKEIERLTKERAQILQEASDKVASAIQKSAAARSQAADANVRSILPDLDQLEQYRTKLEQLRATQGDLDALAGMSAEARQRLTTAMEALTGAVATHVTAQERARASEALTIRSIEARTAAEKAAVEAERQRNAMAGQAVEGGEAERQRQIEAARRASFAQNTREAQDRLRSAEDAAAGAGLTGLPRRLAEMQARERRALEGAEGNLPAYSATQAAFGIERRAATAEAIAGPLRDADRSIAEQAAGLRLQQAAFGASTEAAERMAAAQQLVNRYTADGVPVEGDLRRAIEERAAAVGKLAAAQEDLARRQRSVVGSMDDLRYGLRGGITGALGDVVNGRNPLDSLAKAGERTALSLIERTTVEPLISGLLGSEGKPGGGLLGDTLGGLFGKAAGLPSADITAGVVNVSGPISGLGGLAGAAANGNTPGGSVASLVGSGLPGIGDKASTFTAGRTAGDLDRYASAIRTIESGSAAGNYGALGPITKSGDRAYGAYQVMGNNVPSWTQKALGRTLTPEQFLGDRAAQDAVFRDQFGGSVGRYGNPQDAASVWFTGRPLSQGAGARDVLGTTGSSYVDKFNRALPPAAPAAPTAMAPLSGLDASLGTINSSATKAAEGVASLSGDLSALPGPLSQTAQGLNQVGSSLGSGGGGGLLGMIAQLFSGGAGAGAGAAAAPTVAAAAGYIPGYASGGLPGPSGPASVTAAGIVRGPGTPTSDSILARISTGEGIIRASSVNHYGVDYIKAINEQTAPLPVFAKGGIVGQAPPTARPQVRERAADAAAAQGGGGANVNFVVENHAGVEVKQEKRPTANGGMELRAIIRQSVADELSRPGSDAGRALESTWGLSRTLVRRG